MISITFKHFQLPGNELFNSSHVFPSLQHGILVSSSLSQAPTANLFSGGFNVYNW